MAHFFLRSNVHWRAPEKLSRSCRIEEDALQQRAQQHFLAFLLFVVAVVSCFNAAAGFGLAFFLLITTPSVGTGSLVAAVAGCFGPPIGWHPKAIFAPPAMAHDHDAPTRPQASALPPHTPCTIIALALDFIPWRGMDNGWREGEDFHRMCRVPLEYNGVDGAAATHAKSTASMPASTARSSADAAAAIPEPISTMPLVHWCEEVRQVEPSRSAANGHSSASSRCLRRRSFASAAPGLPSGRLGVVKTVCLRP